MPSCVAHKAKYMCCAALLSYSTCTQAPSTVAPITHTVECTDAPSRQPMPGFVTLWGAPTNPSTDHLRAPFTDNGMPVWYHRWMLLPHQRSPRP